MALRGAFLQPLLRGKHLEESKEVVNNFTGCVLKRCILVFNYQMVIKASFISLNSVRLMGQWRRWLLSFVPIFCSWTRIQAINRKKWVYRATTLRILCIFPLNLFLTEPGLLLVRGINQLHLYQAHSLWICQNYLLDFQQCQTFAPLTVTHHKSTFHLGTQGNHADISLNALSEEHG